MHLPITFFRRSAATSRCEDFARTGSAARTRSSFRANIVSRSGPGSTRRFRRRRQGGHATRRPELQQSRTRLRHRVQVQYRRRASSRASMSHSAAGTAHISMWSLAGFSKRPGVLPAAMAPWLDRRPRDGALCLSAHPPRPKFFPDDPIWTDDDMALDASKAETIEDTNGYDFVINTVRAGRANGGTCGRSTSTRWTRSLTRAGSRIGSADGTCRSRTSSADQIRDPPCRSMA